ncbi:glycosyltransferase family 4 protein [Photobacterium leiognathi]|uniref:glycosyltransferase family 4 protein n=1 Tax=Photobacterium leiognathi TaxID=553611 RepID=UPI0029827ED3|nr:glycosyltransferase family 4 protein [Photobacterium leiognathi]
MKKIVFFIGSLNGSGGTERVSTLIANQLSATGYSVQFLSLCDGENPFFKVNNDIKIDTLFEKKLCFKKNYHKALIKLRKYIKDNKIDIIVNVESMLTLYSVPACIGIDVRNICWEHFNFHVDLGLKLRRYARHLAAFACDDIVTLTETDREFWLANTKHRARITAISNPSSFELCEPRVHVKNKVVLAAGRLTVQKGFDLLLESWALVIKQRQDWTLRIIGSGEDHDALKYQAEKLGLNSNIQWIPHVSNMIEQYQNADIYVMSSRFEGLPMVLLEATSTGLPLVSFDCKTGPREIIDPSCGWLVEDGNTKILSEKLLEAFTTFEKDDVYAQFSQAAIKKCSTDYSLEPIVNKWMRLFDNEK